MPSKNFKKPGPSAGSPFLRSIAGLIILITVVVLTFLLVHNIFPPEISVKSSKTGHGTFEIYPEAPDTIPEHKASGQNFSSDLPEAAIIIDDVGYNKEIAENFASLEEKLTFSVLPNSPHRRSIAKSAHKKGLEIMLHLPMEPNDYPRINPGPDALLVSMQPDEMTDLLKSHIAAIPWVAGVNNHMGSRMTALSSKMYQIFVVLKKENLFFIDSRTTPRTLCRPSARLLQIDFAQRDIFLDHIQTPSAVRRQLYRLLKHAEKTGTAIGIGHPYKVTYDVLREEMGRIKKRVNIVHASELVNPLGQ